MRFKWITLVVPLLALWIAHTVSAREIIQGSDCSVGSNQTIDDNVFVLCRTFTMKGHITGDVIGLAFEAEFDGPVDGNVYMLAGQMDVRDQIGRDLVFAGPVLRVQPTATFEDARADLITASLSTEVFAGARIPGSILSLSYQLLMAGDVGREVNFWGSALTIDGTVGGDVDATVGDPQMGDASQLQTLLVPFRFNVKLIAPGLIVSENAAIEGQLTYSAASPGDIRGNLTSPPVFNEIVTTPDFTQISSSDQENNLTTWLVSYLTVVLREFITLGIVGLLLAYLLPRPLQAPVQQLRARPLNSLGTGILTFILSIGVWVMVLLLILLLVLLFVALNLPDLVIVGLVAIGVLNVGGASALYFIAVYVSRVIVCLVTGRIVVRLALGDDGGMIYLHLLVGIGVLSVVVFIPVIGSVLNALALALGLGAIFLTITQLRGLPPRQAAPVRLPTAPEDARQIPPPIVEDAPRGPGMDNLPSGFHWWHDDDQKR